MKARTTTGKIMLVLAATLLLMLSATLAWAVVSDFQVRGLIPKGVTVAGKDLSGMTEDQARQVIEEAVSAPMMRPVTVTGDNKTWTLEPRGIVTVDVAKMVDEAYSTRRSATLVARLDSQLRGTPLPTDVAPAYAVDQAAIASWIASAAAQIDREPKDATRKLVVKNYSFKITPAVYGATVDQAASAQTISSALTADAALASDSRVATLTIATRKPKVVESSFKSALIVSLDRCRIYLYNGDKLVKSYSCAPGQAAFPTPSGDFKIDTKLRYAPWINPGTAWAKSMPPYIAPGPDNPMGVTKIGIDYPGVFMHGVPPGEFGSIGTHASHGCMRMMPSAVLDLFGRVKVGDPVFIRN